MGRDHQALDMPAHLQHSFVMSEEQHPMIRSNNAAVLMGPVNDPNWVDLSERRDGTPSFSNAGRPQTLNQYHHHDQAPYAAGTKTQDGNQTQHHYETTQAASHYSQGVRKVAAVKAKPKGVTR